MVLLVKLLGGVGRLVQLLHYTLVFDFRWPEDVFTQYSSISSNTTWHNQQNSVLCGLYVSLQY